jgi:glycosyltransferase involved in cell wall biosynthesis
MIYYKVCTCRFLPAACSQKMAVVILRAVAALAALPTSSAFFWPAPTPEHVPVTWFAPFLSGGGYCSEATSIVLSLERHSTAVGAAQHGDGWNRRSADGIARAMTMASAMLTGRENEGRGGIAVCHSEPGAWAAPRAHYHSGATCPPPGTEYRIGRTMFETDRLPDGWAARLNTMDEVWVPSSFARTVFAAGGVAPEKLWVVGQPVDTDVFHPDGPAADLESLARRGGVGRDGGRNGLDASGDASGDASRAPRAGSAFRFLSVFKWEERKGWDVLLRAFVAEFSANDDVALFLLTNPYHEHGGLSTTRDFRAKVRQFAADLYPDRSAADLPRIELLPTGLPQDHMPGLYRGADCFVLPSRGEGWGRPAVEAMSSALPVIATDWGGGTAFLSEDVAFPLAIEGLEPVREGVFARQGHKWAKPSHAGLRAALRQVYADPEAARARGRRARSLMERRFSPSVMAEEIGARLDRARDRVRRRRQGQDVEL